MKNETIRIPYKYFSTGDPSIVHVPENVDIQIYTLEVDSGAQLIIPESTTFTVSTEAGFENLLNCEE